jgi:hypothetical protein
LVQRGARDLHALADAHFPVARALGQRQRQVGRIGLAIAGQPHGPTQVVHGHDGIEIAGFTWSDDVAGDSVRLSDRGRALQLHHTVRGARNRQGAALLPAGCESGFGFQSRVEIGRVADQPRHALVVAQLPDQTGRMPGRARGQPALLEQYDVGFAEGTQVIRDRASHDAAADHDDPRCPRRPDVSCQRFVHASAGSVCGCNGVGARPLRSPPLNLVLGRRLAAVP